MAHKPKIDQNFAPSKATLRGISSQAITRRQIELESCSNPLKTREGIVTGKFAWTRILVHRISATERPANWTK